MTPLLNYTEMATIRRRYGLVVTRQAYGRAYCLDRHGRRCIYTIGHLRRGAKPRIMQRLRNWITGVSV